LERDTVNENVGQNDGDEVRPPLPVIREALYDDAMLYGYVFFFQHSCIIQIHIFLYIFKCRNDFLILFEVRLLGCPLIFNESQLFTKEKHSF
jgi:hypothetical protein